ncbi:MAG: head-tail joining protein [Candidatus Cryosericum sp.]
MTLRDDMLTDAPDAWFDTGGLAQTVTYKVGGAGAGTAIPAVIILGDNMSGQGRYILEEMVAQISQADVPAPRDGDTITLGAGAVWSVRKIKGADALGISWLLGCTKGVRAVQKSGG